MYWGFRGTDPSVGVTKMCEQHYTYTRVWHVVSGKTLLYVLMLIYCMKILCVY